MKALNKNTESKYILKLLIIVLVFSLAGCSEKRGVRLYRNTEFKVWRNGSDEAVTPNILGIEILNSDSEDVETKYRGFVRLDNWVLYETDFIRYVRFLNQQDEWNGFLIELENGRGIFFPPNSEGLNTFVYGEIDNDHILVKEPYIGFGTLEEKARGTELIYHEHGFPTLPTFLSEFENLRPIEEMEIVEGFSDIRSYPYPGNTRFRDRRVAVVQADKEIVTESNLIDFWEHNIYESKYDYFTIDFGDGTGLIFNRVNNEFQERKETSKDRGFFSYVDINEFGNELNVGSKRNRYRTYEITNQGIVCDAMYNHHEDGTLTKSECLNFENRLGVTAEEVFNSINTEQSFDTLVYHNFDNSFRIATAEHHQEDILFVALYEPNKEYLSMVTFVIPEDSNQDEENINFNKVRPYFSDALSVIDVEIAEKMHQRIQSKPYVFTLGNTLIGEQRSFGFRFEDNSHHRDTLEMMLEELFEVTE